MDRRVGVSINVGPGGNPNQGLKYGSHCIIRKIRSEVVDTVREGVVRGRTTGVPIGQAREM